MPDSEYRKRIAAIWKNSDEPLRVLWAWATEPEDPERRADRFAELAEWAGSHKRNQDHDSDEWRAWRKRQRVYRRREQTNRAKDPDEGNVPGVEDGGWHPDARRVQVQSGIGQMSGPPRLVWHTTEGYGLPTYSGSHPHFTIEPKSGTLYQHISIHSGAMALQNLGGGVETNRRSAIQVEIIGFAAGSQSWSEEAYEHLADLARWIEKHASVPRNCGVSFQGNGATPHMSATAWNAYGGHCGHQHVPENNHWDPGAMRINEIL